MLSSDYSMHKQTSMTMQFHKWNGGILNVLYVYELVMNNCIKFAQVLHIY